jgi:7-carboxy-7-deazaguanine synthase
MTDYQVNEIFTSVQGEGRWVGRPATFIRLQGCTVGCEWCDTKYTWKKGGERMDTGSIISQVETYHAVITGGEPTMYNLDELFYRLRQRNKFIQVETSGQQWFKGDILPDWITWSPKENLRWRAPDKYYEHAAEVKWVVDENLTLETVVNTWRKMRYTIAPIPFYFMPEGCPPRPEMIEKTLQWLKYEQHIYTKSWYYSDRIQYRIGVQ